MTENITIYILLNFIVIFIAVCRCENFAKMTRQEEEELCLIDSGVNSLAEICVHRNICSIDLHCNRIVRIENLLQAENVVYLDLSSNLIRKIEGLSALINLKTLNLSANQIQYVEGLRTLISLVHIDLSYNEIGNVEGFLELCGNMYKLAHIRLQGNLLDSVQHLTHCLSKCVNVRSLILSDGENTNPLCSRTDYEKLIFASIPQLLNLNNRNRKGQIVANNEIPNIPAVERYLDVLSSSDISHVSSVQMRTPKIDAALHAHQQRQISKSTRATSTTGTSDVETNHPDSSETSRNVSAVENMKDSTYEKRLAILEQQFAHLQESKTPNVASSSGTDKAMERLTAKRDVDDTDESDSDVTVKPVKRKSTASKGKFGSGIQLHKEKSRMNTGAQTSGKMSRTLISSSSQNLHNDAAVGQKRHDELELMCVELMKDLEAERVEHWKAQQAVRKLADHISRQETELEECHDRELAAEESKNILKRNIASEQKERLKLEAELEIMQERLHEEGQKLKNCEQSELSLRNTIKSQEEMISKADQEYMRRKVELSKKAQEFQLKAAAMAREVELVKIEAKDRNSKIHQLQELVADREQAYAHELTQRIFVGSKEFREIVAKELNEIKNRHVQEVRQLHAAIESRKTEYIRLEDEFREALIVEEERFKELQTAYEKVTLEYERVKKRLFVMEETIRKLNELIKEQNGKLVESSKLKHKFQELESKLAEKEMRKSAIESIKQENVELQSQIYGLKSVIEGLMSEKKQTLSLAQEYGRLEAKIEELEKEQTSVKKQLVEERDLVKIKTKIIDDQNETVKKLKETAAECDGKFNKKQNDLMQIQTELKRENEELTIENQVLKDDVNQLRQRKDELKATRAELEMLLQQTREAREKEQKKYVDAIDGLEQQLQTAVLERNDCRKKLAEEIKVATENQQAAEKRMREMDDAFRKQLDLKEESHQQKIESLLREKEAEMESRVEQKLLDLENEMREILREKEEVEYKYDNIRKCLQKISHGQVF